MEYFWVALGSALGGVTRFWLSGVVAGRLASMFPWNTLVVNVSGSLLIGIVAALSSVEGRIDPHWRSLAVQFFMVGICGGYTTFSSFSLQTLNLARDGQWLYAAANALLSMVLCLFAVWLGYGLGQFLNR